MLQSIAAVQLEGVSGAGPHTAALEPSSGDNLKQHVDKDRGAIEGRGSDSEHGSEWDIGSSGYSSSDEGDDAEREAGNGELQHPQEAGKPQGGVDTTEKSEAAVGSCSGSSLPDAAGCNAVTAMRKADCRRAVAGLPGRLRFLRRCGLLPASSVFKLFNPDACNVLASSTPAKVVHNDGDDEEEPDSG